MEKSFTSKLMDKVQPFVIGGYSGCFATCIVQPMDMLKVRIQIKSEQVGKGSVSPFVVLKEIYSQGGLKSFYKGLDSALARQIFYTTTRMGIYKTLFMNAKAKNGGREPSLLSKCYCASFAGFIGSLVGNPADLALIRMQADTMLPLTERRNYTNVFNAFTRIVKDEGFLALWRGCTPTVIRAVVLNLAMLAPYDEIKEQLNKLTNNPDSKQIRLMASASAGLLASFCSLPLDNAKTKIQKMKAVNGVFPYKNIFDALYKTVSNEGVTRLWVGLPTYCVRIAPHVVITLLIQDYLTDQVNQWRKMAKF